jgi:hypothetical protein
MSDKTDQIVQQQKQSIEMLMLGINQQQQIIDQYRVNIYNLELKTNLLIKMMEEKGIFAVSELDKRWPLYLKNDIGVIDQNGVMSGNIKVTFYGEKGNQQ